MKVILFDVERHAIVWPSVNHHRLIITADGRLRLGPLYPSCTSCSCTYRSECHYFRARFARSWLQLVSMLEKYGLPVSNGVSHRVRVAVIQLPFVPTGLESTYTRVSFSVSYGMRTRSLQRRFLISLKANSSRSPHRKRAYFCQRT